MKANTRRNHTAASPDIAALLDLDDETRRRIERILGSRLPRFERQRTRLAYLIDRAIDESRRPSNHEHCPPSPRSGRRRVESGATRRPPPFPRLSGGRRFLAPFLWSILAHGLLVIALHLIGVLDEAEKVRTLTVSTDVLETPLEDLAPLEPDAFEAVADESLTTAPLADVAEPLNAVDVALDLVNESSSGADPQPVGRALDGVDLMQVVDRGKRDKTSFFGVAAEGQAICFLVDSSRSMRGKFDLARLEVLRSIAQLNPQQRFYVLLFDHNVERMRLGESTPMQPAPATAENKRLLALWLRQTQMESSCDAVAALDAALSLKADVLFLLTDGELPGSLAGMLRERNRVTEDGRVRRKMAVNTIGLHSLRGQPLLAQLARENGGAYRFIAKPNR